MDSTSTPESYTTVTVGSRTFVRRTDGVPQTVHELWRRNPAMMIPDSAGYRPATREVDLSDL